MRQKECQNLMGGQADSVIVIVNCKWAMHGNVEDTKQHLIAPTISEFDQAAYLAHV